MTTEITKTSHPRLPSPDRYTAFLERLAAEHEAKKAEARRQRQLAWAIGLCWTVVGVVLIAAFYWDFL